MWGDIMDYFKCYIKDHFFAFCLSLGIWITCVLLGSFAALGADSNSARDTDLYIQSIVNDRQGYFEVLINGITNNFWHTLILCASSSFLILLPCTLFLIAFKGFSTGFSASFIIRLYALKGVAATIAAVVMPLCFSLPVYFVMYISSMEFPLNTFRLRKEISSSERWRMYLYHTAKLFVLFMILNVITSVEAFLSPKLFGVLKG